MAPKTLLQLLNCVVKYNKQAANVNADLLQVRKRYGRAPSAQSRDLRLRYVREDVGEFLHGAHCGVSQPGRVTAASAVDGEFAN